VSVVLNVVVVANPGPVLLLDPLNMAEILAPPILRPILVILSLVRFFALKDESSMPAPVSRTNAKPHAQRREARGIDLWL